MLRDHCIQDRNLRIFRRMIIIYFVLYIAVANFEVHLWVIMNRCQHLVRPSRLFWKWFRGMAINLGC